MSVEAVIQTANNIFRDESPSYRHLRLPVSRNRIANLPAIWTRDGLRPRWGNLALTVAEATDENPPTWWESEVAQQIIPTTVLIASDRFLLLEYDALESGKVKTTDISQTLLPQLKRLRERLFSPKSLSQFKHGQLSFADLENDWIGEGFAQHMRHTQRRLDDALTQGVQQAIQEQRDDSKQGLDTVFNIALAYMAARILEDKGFFGEEALPSNNDPVALLSKTITKTNGFFQVSQRLISQLNDNAVQALASNLGQHISFALTDHRDVGRLYEQALKKVFAFDKSNTGAWQEGSLLALQQYYTPVAIAQQMLAHLPLERIRPEERVIYDPAAGSGSLLLAASQRLAQMADVAIQDHPHMLLAENIIGNDLDPNAKLLTKLRYLLIRETLSESNDILPEPKFFGMSDYLSDDAWQRLPKRPTVIVANPPFKENGTSNSAAEFVISTLARLTNEDQFAFVLPRTFLTATTHRWPQAQTAITQQCQVLDVWQLSSGVVGLSAAVDVAVVLGIVGRPVSQYAITRAMLAKKKQVKNSSIEEGFLGHARIQAIGTEVEFSQLTAPQIDLSVPTIRLGDLFYSCSGVTPEKGFLRLSEAQLQFVENINHRKVKLYWQHSWLSTGSLWANPANVPEDEKYTIYDKDYLYRPSFANEHVYDSLKILISRSTNVAAQTPFSAYLDTEGFCPSNHTYCVVPHWKTNEQITIPNGWDSLGDLEKLLWLVGILNSRLLEALSMVGRGSRQLVTEQLLSLPLPIQVDQRIIEVTKHIIDIERGIRQDGDIDSLKEQLDELVQLSYGNPYIPPAINYDALAQEWAREKQEACFVSTGQVMDVDLQRMQILLYLDNLDDEIEEAWIPLPQNLPAWALDGTLFDVEIPRSISTFDELTTRPWALQNFRHTPRPYLSLEDLQGLLLTKMGVA